MPLMYSVLMDVPMRGALSMRSAGSSNTSRTESTMPPMMMRSPSKSTSTMMMQVSTVVSARGMPNLRRRSMTGTACPRRLMTPRMNSGVRGILVMDVSSSTSRTLAMSRAKTSLPRVKVRCWLVSTALFSAMMRLLLAG